VSANFKIRLLLFLLTISFAATAITINLTFNKTEVLEFNGRTLEKNLQKKENFIKKFLDDSTSLEALKNVHNNPAYAARLISDFRDDRSIYVYTYYGNQQMFWGGNRVSPEATAGMKEGSSLLRRENGWYEAIKRSDGNFSAVCIIPIKAEYRFQNKHLKNVFAPDLITENNIEIAGFNDKQVFNIKNAEGKFLFAIKLKSTVTNTFYSKLELWMWIITACLATIFINFLAVSIATRGHTKSAVVLFFSYFLLVRLVTLQFNWLDSYFDVPVFDAKYYSGGYFFPTLGDFLINSIIFSWFLSFIYSYRFEIKISSHEISKWGAIAISILLGFIIYLVAFQHNEIFFSLVTRSNINFDVTNIVNLDLNSWLGILLMCIAILNLYLLIEIGMVLGESLPLLNRDRLIVFLTGLGVILLIQSLFDNFSIFIFFFSIIIFLRGWAFYNKDYSYKLVIFLFTILLFSIICSIKLSSFQNTKERVIRKGIAHKLESADDPNAVLLFFSLEQEILRDSIIQDYFIRQRTDGDALHSKLRKLYFDGYLSRYDFDIYTSRAGHNNGIDSININNLKNLVISGSIKVSEYFYRVNNTFGLQSYFALIPIPVNKQGIVTLAIRLQSKTFKDEGSFPEVLADGKINTDEQLNKYSFAFYSNGRLLNQNGTYNYNLVNTDFKGKSGKFIFTEKNGYSHVIYQSTPRKVIVVSKPVITWLMQLASVSFLFLVTLFFSIVIVLTHQAWVIFHDDNFRLNAYRWSYLISRNRILYKTRIQASLVSAIVLTLLIVGAITYFSISDQFRKQQEQELLDQINQVKNGLENKVFSDGKLTTDEQSLHAFANINAADLNLYDNKGNVIFTTQPNIYDYGFIIPKMNALAFIYINKYQRSEYLNHEQVGRMKFIAAYKPIRNNRNETIAYLSLPYYSNEHDYDLRVGSYLNTLINVYALVLVVIALFAIFVANEITYPLTLVGKSLGAIKIGSKNEPIQWKSNDEIGSLIQEYNNMIRALEDSAKKLARSERESAWREMAKQVAHEIKNPLTPLKLGVQLLEKSWKEKDPNFDRKFDRFSKSFIEQIDSLSLIASEFSNFAKMPDTPFENINLPDIILKSIEGFRDKEDLVILFRNIEDDDVIVRGGKDHLFRIFNNLLKNAVEAIPDSRNGYIEIFLSVQDDKVFIEVKDNGKGIPADLQERIFNPNFTTKSSGTGLGLAFVKQAVENMFGSVRFETEDDKGTTFYITLPLAGLN